MFHFHTSHAMTYITLTYCKGAIDDVYRVSAPYTRNPKVNKNNVMHIPLSIKFILRSLLRFSHDMHAPEYELHCMQTSIKGMTNFRYLLRFVLETNGNGLTILKHILLDAIFVGTYSIILVSFNH